MAITEDGLGEVGAFRSAIYFDRFGTDEQAKIEEEGGSHDLKYYMTLILDITLTNLLQIQKCINSSILDCRHRFMIIV